jgi:competence protein ComEC
MWFTATGWFVPLRDDAFDLARQRTGAQASFDVSELTVVSPPRGVHAVAARVRRGLSDAVSDIDPRRAALLEGLTIGETSGLSQMTIDSFRAAGLSHVLAVSGSNVAIVLAAVSVALGAMGSRSRITLSYIALALFVLVVGPDASVLRAGVMGAITLACLLKGKTAEPLAALGLAVIAVIALRPGMLFSPGLQLSAAATAGIVVFCEPLARRLALLPQALRLMLAATLAAQIAVAPLLILVFGEISLIAPVANALALPAVGPATVLGLGAGLLSTLVPTFGRPLGALVSPAAGWILAVADRFGAFSWSLVHVPVWVGWPLLAVIAGAAGRILRRGPSHGAG